MAGENATTWQYMKAQDAISGKEGTLIATWKNSSGANENYSVAECKNINAKVTKNKSEFKSLGERATQHKAMGWTGTGTLTLHYASTKWASIMSQYANQGVDVYFTLTVTNHDPTSSLGTQTIVLYNVNLDEVELTKLDTEAEFLDQTMNFTFDGFEITSSFGPIQ